VGTDESGEAAGSGNENSKAEQGDGQQEHSEGSGAMMVPFGDRSRLYEIVFMKQLEETRHDRWYYGHLA
jgi:hypothetical protein